MMRRVFAGLTLAFCVAAIGCSGSSTTSKPVATTAGPQGGTGQEKKLAPVETAPGNIPPPPGR
jgi:hypothetical protein